MSADRIKAPEYVYVDVSDYGLPEKVWAGGDVADCVKYVRADLAALPAIAAQVAELTRDMQILTANKDAAHELRRQNLERAEAAEAKVARLDSMLSTIVSRCDTAKQQCAEGAPVSAFNLASGILGQIGGYRDALPAPVELEICCKCMGSGYGGHPDSGLICADCNGSGGIAALPEVAPGVRVKPLVWEEGVRGRWIGTPPAKLGDLAFWIFQSENGYLRHIAGQGAVTYPSLDAAKAAAQADYDARILAALEPAPDLMAELVDAVDAYKTASAHEMTLPTDRGGMNGPKGKAIAETLRCKGVVFAALAKIKESTHGA